MTIRRTIHLLNRLGITETINGVGTRVALTQSQSTGIPFISKELTLEGNLKSFLEAVQLLAIISEDVFIATFPYCSAELLVEIEQAITIQEQYASMIATISSCLQAVVRCCPFMAIREIFEKITLLLLNGSALRLNMTGEEPVSYWPDLRNALSRGLTARDGRLFAAEFRKLMEIIFTEMKQKLLESGVAAVEDIVAPM